MLPKHWGEPVGGGKVAEQLAAKQLSHNSLLAILSAAGVLQQPPPPVLRCLLPATLRAHAQGGGRLSSPAEGASRARYKAWPYLKYVGPNFAFPLDSAVAAECSWKMASASRLWGL